MTTYALQVSASFFGRVVEETFARQGATIQIGNSSALAIPVPEGLAYVARATWSSATSVEVVDGAGRVHRVDPEQDALIDLGAVSLTLALVPRYRLRRTAPVPWRGSLAWFVIVLATSLVPPQVMTAWSLRCETVPLFEVYMDGRYPGWMAACFPEVGSGVSGKFTAEYLARLLEEDYAGADQGPVTTRLDRESHAKEALDFYLPAGAAGPHHTMGGAAETAESPSRTAESDGAHSGEEHNLLIAEEQDGTPVELEIPEAGVADADEPASPPPAEEEEGWGIPDWYDEEDRALERLEIELMLRHAQEQLRIDPDDGYALSVLSYYQYLAQDYPAAEETYDRFISLYPEDAAGYNNKALIYKRRGQYAREEGLYRIALALMPDDDTALNNLAVNLSHQGRHAEALRLMDRLEEMIPGDPYADLHRAKIHADMGDEDMALHYLERALQGMARLDTLHHIEFRQDIRLDPSFEQLRRRSRFRALLWEYYGEDTPLQE